MEIGRTANGEELVAEIGRNDDEAKAEGREDRFGEGPDVDDASVGIESMEAWEWTRPIAELAVVIVFDDPRAGVACPLQQRQTADEGHRYTERKLVGRRDVGHSRIGSFPRGGVNVEPISVDAHRDDACAGGHQRAARARIAGLLEPHTIALIEQHRRDRLEPALCAGDDEHLFWFAPRATRRFHVSGNRLA